MSKLVKIRLENFMSLPLAEFEFDGCNIISPCGYNDSGKSAVTRALEVLWYDSYSQMQAKFITDGKNYFKISNFFDDNIEISRTKFLNGSSLWLLAQHIGSDVKVLYTNQLANGTYAACRGVPEPIQAYLQIYQDEVTGEELNVRRNTNKLLLVATTGGENYKFINALAQGEKLACATGKLNEDVNAKNRAVYAISSQLTAQRDVLGKLKVFEQSKEQAILEAHNKLTRGTARLAAIISIAEKLNACRERVPKALIKPVDISRLEKLSQIKNHQALMQRKTRPVIKLLDTDKLMRLYKLSELRKTGNIKIKPVISSIPEIKISQIEKLQDIRAIRDKLDTSNIQASISELNALKSELKSQAEANNWHICPQCGYIISEEANCSC